VAGAADAAADPSDARLLAGVVRDRIGLKPALSAPKIEAWLQTLPTSERRARCRDLLAHDAQSRVWRDFAELLLVHETYFFRHPDQLRLLAHVLLPRLLGERIAVGRRELRVWCAGCSSGEEVYTLALLVQTAIRASAVPSASAWNVSILGTDLSLPMLELARAGRYALLAGLNSFRDVPEFARHHFASILSAAETTWSAGPELRRLVRFFHHNLVSDPPPLDDADLVVCRNTLIYFDDVQQRGALAALEGGLRPGGALLLGPAETASENGRLEMVCAEQALYWSKK
jgi:chemotaxis protein methyltransferase CheR